MQPAKEKPAKQKQPKKPKQPMELWKKIAVVVVVLAVVVAAVGADLTGQFTTYPPLPSSVKNAPLCSLDSNATLPCGLAANPQGIFVVVAAKVIPSSSNNGGGNLTLTLVHTGLYANTELYATISPFGYTDYVQVMRASAIGQTQNFTSPIPASAALVPGQKYEVKIDSLFYSATQGDVAEELSIALTASQPPVK
jgi:hypothetical protein